MAITDHPNWKEIKSFTEEMIDILKTEQSAFYIKNKAFFHGLTTPTLESGELDGTTDTPIAYGLKPSDQTDSWNTFASKHFNEDTKFPLHLSVSVYDAPEGMGWKVQLEFFKEALGPDSYGTDGNHWIYYHNEGPVVLDGIWNEWHIKYEGD